MKINGLLLDIQGVLLQEGEPFEGAVETFEKLLASGYSIRCLTNNSKKSKKAIIEEMKGMGFSSISQEMLFTPVVAACRFMEQEGIKLIHLAASPQIVEDFQAFEFTDKNPDAVILGDLYRDFTYDRLNGLFQLLRGGARLITLHKNRYCLRETGIGLNLGPFVVALEYAADTKSIVLGKPQKSFFDMALADMGLPASEVLMVGDDIEADVGGGQNAGMRALQVETGKFQQKDKCHQCIQPEDWLASIKGLPDWLEQKAKLECV